MNVGNIKAKEVTIYPLVKSRAFVDCEEQEHEAEYPPSPSVIRLVGAQFPGYQEEKRRCDA